MAVLRAIFNSIIAIPMTDGRDLEIHQLSFKISLKVHPSLYLIILKKDRMQILGNSVSIWSCDPIYGRVRDLLSNFVSVSDTRVNGRLALSFDSNSFR